MPVPIPVITITSPTTATGRVGVPFGYIPTTVGSTPIAWSALTGLPPGLIIDASSGVISGTPTTVSGSPFAIYLSCTASGGGTSYPFTLTLTIQNMPSNYVRNVNFAKLSGVAFFTPDGATSAINLGDIVMHKLSYGTGEVEAMRHRKGAATIGDQAVTEIKPKFEITLGEQFKPLLPIVLFGTTQADLVQASATASTFAVASSKTLQSYFCGKRGLTNYSLKNTALTTTFVENTDYQIDPDLGWVTIMEGGTIADGTGLVLTFDCRAVTLNKYQAFSQLNRRGKIDLYEEDTQAAGPRNHWSFPCNLMPTDLGDRDAKKYAEAKITCAVLANPTVLVEER